MNTLTADEILDRAAALLDEQGWCRGHLGTADGPKCALGALRVAGGSEWTGIAPHSQQYRLARGFLDALLVEDYGYTPSTITTAITMFNDSQRDKRKVQRALRRAARRVRAGKA